ncbi:putative membrane protein, partial [Acinetobacter baumannii 662545-1347]
MTNKLQYYDAFMIFIMFIVTFLNVFYIKYLR